MKELDEEKRWELISRYLGNELNDAEKNELNEWMAADAQNREEFENARKIWELSDIRDIDDFNTDQGWILLKKRFGRSSEQSIQPIRKISFNVYRIAASIIILMVTGFLLVYFTGKPGYIKYTAGSKLNNHPLILADGTKVYLNKGSEIWYPKKFKSDTRMVKLIGEAFFEVTRNEKQPFVIQTPQANVQVLGTSFNVLAKNNSDSVQVTVKTGVVSLSSLKDTKKIIIHKGNTGVIFVNRNQFKLSSTDINMNSFAWKTDSIVFKNSKLSFVTQTLERIFDEKIIIDNDKLKNCPVSADFKDQDLHRILESIGTVHGLKVNKTNKGYILTGAQCE